MLKKSFVPMIMLSLIAGLFGCSTLNSTSSTPTPETIPSRAGVYSYLGTQSPGDPWSWTIGEGTYISTNETTGFYYSGTYVSYPSGFNKLTVAHTNDPTVPIDGSATAYFLEYPETMLVVSGQGENPMVCTAKATAAPLAGRYNFVDIPWPGWSAVEDTYGTVEVTVSGGLYTFNIRTYNLFGTVIKDYLETDFSFTDGRLVKSGNPLQIFMTPSGAFFGDSGPASGGFCGSAYQSVDLNDLVSKQYRGYLFSCDSASCKNLETTPIGAEPNTTLTTALNGFAYEDVELNTRLSDTGVVQFSAQDETGVISAKMHEPSGAITDFKMVVSKVSGKYIVMGISQNSGGHPQNMLLVEI